MRQEHFEIQNRKLWNEFNLIVKEIDKPPLRGEDRAKFLQLPSLYRQICNHYALALSREYSPALVEYLHSMALEGHQHIYRYHAPWFTRVIHFISSGFPTALRQNILYFIIALSLFFLPALLMGFCCYHKHELIYSILDDHNIAQIEYMYDPSNRKVGRTESRSADTNVAMFGFYIKNNTGIGFRTFAGGALAGLGTLFFLLYNGIFLGGIAGYITRLGFIDTFWPFVSGHGSFELTAIVISGASGLMLAHAIIAPGSSTRIQKLKDTAPEALKLIAGAAVMFFIAAFIEAFWSSSSAPVHIKYAAASILWSLVILYFVFAGRRKGAK